MSDGESGSSETNKPEWIRKQRSDFESGVAKIGISQTVKSGFPTAGSSMAPSTEGTGKSPIVGAAEQGNLPARVVDGPEIKKGQKEVAQAEKESRLGRILENARERLNIESKSPKS
jgi:hypothetical protein